MARLRTLASCHCLFPQAGSSLKNYGHGNIPSSAFWGTGVLVWFSIQWSHVYVIFLCCQFVFLRNHFAVNHLLFETSCLCLSITWIESPCPETNVLYSISLHSRRIETLTSCMPRRIKMLKWSFTPTTCLHIQNSAPTIKCVFFCCSFLG